MFGKNAVRKEQNGTWYIYYNNGTDTGSNGEASVADAQKYEKDILTGAPVDNGTSRKTRKMPIILPTRITDTQ